MCWTRSTQHPVQFKVSYNILIAPISVFFFSACIEWLVTCGDNYCSHIEFEFFNFLVKIYRLGRACKPAQVAANAMLTDGCAKRHSLGKRDIYGFSQAYAVIELVRNVDGTNPVSYTHLRAHETRHDLVCRLLLE